VVASVIYDKPAMAVDTHVFRVSNRLGLTKAKTPLQSEQQLIKYIPEKHVATAHHWLILHGRYTCLARTPKCEICPLTEWCHYFKTNYLKTKPTNVSTTKKVTTKTLATKVKSVSKKAATKEEKSSNEKFVPHSTSLKAGDKAPAFKAKDQHGKTITLADFKGKNVVLYFYPKDSTPTCTIEACNLRDEYKLLSKKNLIVLGVSADDEKMHLKFATKNELPFSLLADTDMAIIKAYDVWGTKQFMGKIFDGILRTTFIIDEKGIIKQVITKVNPRNTDNRF